MNQTTMSAVRWHGRGDVRYETVPRASSPGPGEIRVHVAWCGLCGSDVHEYLHGPFQVPVQPHPTTKQSAPITLGHEISGWVDAIGPRVSGLRHGDLVVLNALLPCERCAPCGRGEVHLCTALGHLGMSADGGLAGFVTVPAAMAVPVPSHVPSEVAALAEPFAVAVHMVRQAAAARGPRAVVVGAGAIGLATALLLRAEGTEVRLVDVAGLRLAHARELGFAAGKPEDDHGSWPLVFECSGAEGGLSLAVGLGEPGGLLVLAGLPAAPARVDAAAIVLRELRLVGSMSHLVEPDLRPAVDFLAAHPGEAARLITGRVPLADAVSGGLDVLAGPDRGRHAKVLVRVGARD
ncbi:2,3-butanediol dehydrogenase [Amycolatopsis endophytica]|uniref:(R,R)-butanediol dehydrogenase/meso-butanediol dehydrogenase/diacetyl reductase n=1 Tax=Amycolatopsis endophytica TaxID=860233 RepID=A0A853BAC4_9PSEU|nr:alcohol dehydrogenase catalytic domain-containing protein [Amycolatopsis endophytica]NYI92298.1 (R,R)-butanediol dehydrogenase/meso-butanediol dehydrogenase/diacetyl reductase [Amycolatopsis endophytica]